MMSKDASLLTRIFYCVVLLGAILPVGIAKFGWVALATGSSLAGSFPYIGPILFLIIGFYRIYVVALTPSTLNAIPISGFISFLPVSYTHLDVYKRQLSEPTPIV